VEGSDFARSYLTGERWISFNPEFVGGLAPPLWTEGTRKGIGFRERASKKRGQYKQATDSTLQSTPVIVYLIKYTLPLKYPVYRWYPL
jgi:hypothetical protein